MVSMTQWTAFFGNCVDINPSWPERGQKERINLNFYLHTSHTTKKWENRNLSEFLF